MVIYATSIPCLNAVVVMDPAMRKEIDRLRVGDALGADTLLRPHWKTIREGASTAVPGIDQATRKDTTSS